MIILILIVFAIKCVSYIYTEYFFIHNIHWVALNIDVSRQIEEVYLESREKKTTNI